MVEEKNRKNVKERVLSQGKLIKCDFCGVNTKTKNKRIRKEYQGDERKACLRTNIVAEIFCARERFVGVREGKKKKIQGRKIRERTRRITRTITQGWGIIYIRTSQRYTHQGIKKKREIKKI